MRVLITKLTLFLALSVLTPPVIEAAERIAPPTGPSFSLVDFQVFPDPLEDLGPYLPSGDRVSWGYVATGLVWPNGTHRAWRLSDMGEGVKVAILDTGVDRGLLDLRGRVAASKDFTGEGPQDDHGHGTAMASILAANIDGEGIAGVAPRARVFAGKVLNSLGLGIDQWIAEGINWAVQLRVDIISMSFGGQGPCTRFPLSSGALQRALDAGIRLVASGGNAGPPEYPRTSSVICPASLPGVVSVSSSGKLGRAWFGEDGTLESDFSLVTEISGFSSRGPEISLASPGMDILTWRQRQLAAVSGTSPAAPQVAGLMALMLNRYGENANVLSRLPQMGRNELSFKNGLDAFYGHGLVNATDALTPEGDINGDLRVDDGDSRILSRALGCTRPMSCYAPAADQDWDGDVDQDDGSLVARFYGSRGIVERTSVWDLEPVVFRRTIFGIPDPQTVTRYGFSGNPDMVTFGLTYENSEIWNSLLRRATSLTVTVCFPETRTSISRDILHDEPGVFKEEGPWYYSLTLRTYNLVNGLLVLPGWKLTISSGLGYSHDLLIIVRTLPYPPFG